MRLEQATTDHDDEHRLDPNPDQTTVDGAPIGSATRQAAHRTRAQQSGEPERYAAVDGRKYFTGEAEPVSREAAIRNARASMATGYATGLATGSGLGALATVLLGVIFRRR